MSTSGLSFDPLKKLGGSSSVGVSLVLYIFKPCDFDSNTFFQRFFGHGSKPSLGSCRHYTLSYARYYINRKFYKKLKLGPI
jgi:hypothetical protein